MPPKKNSSLTEVTYPSQVWTPERMDYAYDKPWDNDSWSLEQKATGLVREMIAGLYALHQEHIEFCYGYTGWPADTSVWLPLEVERNECVGMDELPLNQDSNPTRYGASYSLARQEFEQLEARNDGQPKEWNEQRLERFFQYWIAAHLITGRWVDGSWYGAEIPKLLIEHNHSLQCRASLIQAARSLDDLHLGSGSARKLTAKLRRETQGCRAMELTEQRLVALRESLRIVLNQPFEIERDFAFLAQDFAVSLNHALLLKTDHFSSGFRFDRITEPNTTQSTLGAASGDSLAGISSQWTKCESTSDLIRIWTKAYRDRMDGIAQMWRDSEDLPKKLYALADFISNWQIHPNIRNQFESLGIGPREREAVERAKVKVVKRIGSILRKRDSLLVPKPTVHRGISTEPRELNEKAITSVKPLSYPIIARICWCMVQAGHGDHRLTDAPSANRLANQYGKLETRAGEKLKQESDRFGRSGGKTYLMGGPSERHSYGKKLFSEVRNYLRGKGHTSAAEKAEDVLRDLD